MISTLEGKIKMYFSPNDLTDPDSLRVKNLLINLHYLSCKVTVFVSGLP